MFSTTINNKWLRRERRLNASKPIAPLVTLLNSMDIPFDMLDDDGDISITKMNDHLAKTGIFAEKMSKKFYDVLAKKRKGFELFLAWVDSEKNKDWYVTALLNRLMFIYFIQHRGIMKGETAYLRNRLNDCIGHDFNFYRDFFLPLCFFGFAKPWKERIQRGNHFDGIPYLNGGLFMPHQVEIDHGITPEAVETGTLPPEITIPNEQFKIWFDFFDEFRWTLDEEKVENEGQINPDVLGFIFEKYINQKQMGAYYTKEDITGYICRNTIIPRLFDMLAATGSKGAKAVNPLPIGPHPNLLNDGKGISGGEGIERYIYPAVKTQEHLPTETDREYLARQQRFDNILNDFEDGKITTINDFITYNLDIEKLAMDFIANIQDAEVLRDFYFNGLRKITVLDPTCGSGAFLFAGLKILYPLYAACVKKMEDFHTRESKDETIAITWKGEFAFANDVDQQLTFIDTPENDKKAIVKQLGNELTSIKDHDNVEYFIHKRIIVDNLFGVDIMAEAVEICKLRLFLKLIAHAEPDTSRENLGIEPLPDVDFNILCGNTLVGFATHDEAREAVMGKAQLSIKYDDDPMDIIDKKAQVVEEKASEFRLIQTGNNTHATIKQKNALKEALKNLENELNGYLARQYGIVLQESPKYRDWLKNCLPFHWYVDFYKIMKSGGFDVIVGNPPYVEYTKVKKDYTIKNYKTENCGNLYAYILERNKSLLQSDGKSGMIIPHSSICTDRMSEVQELLLTNSIWVSTYCIRPAKLFTGVDQRLAIYLSGRNKNIFTTKYHHWNEEFRPYLLSNIEYSDITGIKYPCSIPKVSNLLETTIWKKINKKSKLSNFNVGSQITYFHNAPRYWIRAMNFKPYFWNERDGEQLSTQVKSIYMENYENSNIVTALLNSSLFFWWFIILSDCRHLNNREIENFPLDPNSFTDDEKLALTSLVSQLMESYQGNSKRKECQYASTGKVIYDEYYPRFSKPIIDEIDRVLAKHYGFTDEELDFIINYDIKYRMGRDAEEEG